MKRVLLVCYYFPPLGGAGVTRPLALFRHLPEFGYECHVLTVKPVAYRSFEPDLLEGLPVDRIYRSGSSDPQRLMYLLGVRLVKDRTIRGTRTISDRYFPDPKIGWVRRAVALGRTLLSNRDYDAIISTSPPISAHLAARKLSREFGRPWIADFRDFWGIQPPERVFADHPSRLRRARKLLEAIQAEATDLTAVNPTIGGYVGAPHVVYNCYDDILAQGWRIPTDSRFIIGVLGAINDTTPIAPLLRVLDQLRRERPDLFARIMVRQVGEADPAWLNEQLESYRLHDRFELYGWQSRRETVNLLSETSLMYLGVGSEHDRGLSTGRVYTMLSSGRPVLAYAPPDSELRRLIESTGGGFTFYEPVLDPAVAHLAGLVEAHGRGQAAVMPRPAYAEPYGSRKMAEQFAAILGRYAAPAYR